MFPAQAEVRGSEIGDDWLKVFSQRPTGKIWMGFTLGYVCLVCKFLFSKIPKHLGSNSIILQVTHNDSLDMVRMVRGSLHSC
jgi:hypothetical protein